MQLWLAGLLFIISVLAIVTVGILSREKKRWIIPTIVGLSVISLVLLLYIVLTIIFVSDLTNDQAINQTEPPLVEILKPVKDPEVPNPAVKPANYDFPIADVPESYPDVLGIKDDYYEEMPIFGTQNEVTKYVLHQFLNNQFECEFYLTTSLVLDEGTGYNVLFNSCETAMSYFLFSAYQEYDMFTDKRDDESNIYAKIKLIYEKPEYDLEARAEALEFIMKNPVPTEGFKDFETEKAYARKIQDFIARKVTYSPIGYDPEILCGLGKYEALQEAYNVLGEEENTAICASYARAFALIAQHAGINAAWVLGNQTETESHAWNVIYPCDGSEPVLVDVTWDDTESDDSPDQEYVSDRWFYTPLSQEYEHIATEHFEEFIKFINMNKKQ